MTLAPPGWQAKRSTSSSAKPAARQDAGDRRRDVLLRERRDRAVEDHAEALRIDVPAHDVERVGPGVLAAHLDGGDAAVAGAQHAGRGAVAEQRGRDDVRLGQLVEPERQRAELDRDEQHDAARPRLRQPGGDREPGDAAGAAEAEDRHALDIGAKAHASGDARFEARRRDAGRRDGDDRVDVGGVEARPRPARLVAASTKSWHAPSR